MKKALVIVILLGLGVFLYLLFTGPRMRTQPSLRTYRWQAPLPPPDAVPVGSLPAVGESGMQAPLPIGQEACRRGRVYYEYYCIQCHGKTAAGDGPVGESLLSPPPDLRKPRVRAMSDATLMQTMLKGPGHEPVLARIVSPERQAYLAAYLRSLSTSPPASLP